MLVTKKLKTTTDSSFKVQYKHTMLIKENIIKKDVLNVGERPPKEIIFEDSKEIHYKLENGTTLKVNKKVRRTKKNTPDLYGINAVAIKSNTTNKDKA